MRAPNFGKIWDMTVIGRNFNQKQCLLTCTTKTLIGISL